MAFQRIKKSSERLGDYPATITIGTSGRPGHSRQVYLSLSAKTRKMLGDPAAFVLDWDPDAWLLRIAVSTPDDPDAYRTGKSPRVGITTAARTLGLVFDTPVTVPVRAAGRGAAIADLSTVTTAGTVHPIKGAAA